MLGVEHIIDDVTDVATDDAGIKHVVTKNNDHIRGDIFVDCTGFSARLIEKALDLSLIHI